MPSAAAVQSAIDGYWRDEDYEDRMVAIAAFEVDGEGGLEAPWLARQLRDCHGMSVEASWPCVLAVFPRLVDAVAFARRLRDRLNGHCRIGLNLAEFEATAAGEPGKGSSFAKRLMEQSGPGGITISAVAGQRVTSRLLGGDDGRAQVGGWRGNMYAGLQWGGLLGYFAAWCYAIYWMISYYIIHGTYPCFPKFMCG
jgi:hypothetical protein